MKRPAKIDQLNGLIILDVKYKKVSITRLCMVSKHILFLIKEKWKPTVEFFIPLNSKSVLETMLLNTRSSEYIEGLV